MTTKRARVLVIVGVVGLVSMRVAYDLTYEPAPAVRVEWRKGIADWRRKWFEIEYRLEDPQAPHGMSYAYVLFDTRPSNIRALVTNRWVAGTGDIDRTKFEVPWVTWQETSEFTWIADRIPLLRYRTIRWAVISIFLGMILVGARLCPRRFNEPPLS